jgi:cell division septation protein DedD
MNYEFSVNKMALVSSIAASIFVGVLLFGAGLVVGSQWLVEGSIATATSAQNKEPAGPQEPVLHDAQAPAQKPAQPGIQKPETPKTPAAGVPEQTMPPAEAAATAAATAANGEVQIIQEAAAEGANGENAASDPEFVTVQIGVFLDEQEANRLLKDVERKGYAPSFFSGRDAEARQWYAVRIGAYSDRQQAANAAANFTKQEKIRATVRPLGSL